MEVWLRILTGSVLIKIAILVILWIASLWTYFHFKFKKERNILPPEKGYKPFA